MKKAATRGLVWNGTIQIFRLVVVVDFVPGFAEQFFFDVHKCGSFPFVLGHPGTIFREHAQHTLIVHGGISAIGGNTLSPIIGKTISVLVQIKGNSDWLRSLGAQTLRHITYVKTWTNESTFGVSEPKNGTVGRIHQTTC
jgi:hypothetical protein